MFNFKEKIMGKRNRLPLLPLGETTAVSVTDAAIQKKIYGSGMATLNNLKQRNGRYYEIVKSCPESGLLIKVSVNRTYSSSLLHAIIACNHLPLFKIFSNFVHFCPDSQIFCPFFPVEHFLSFFCPFFWKIARMPLLSRIGPVKQLKMKQKNK